MRNLRQSILARTQNWEKKHFEKTRYGKRLSTFRELYDGQRCFFIGNGPSLRVDDLDTLLENQEITFAFNRIFNIFDQTKWRPSFYISQDEKMLQGCIETVESLDMGIKFLPINLKWYYGISLSDVNWFLMKAPTIDGWKPIDFSQELPKCIYNSSTVMYTAAQIAAYMGFREIYLIGTDHRFHISKNINGEVIINNSVSDYFSEKYNEDKESLYIPNTEISTFTYIAMKEQCNKRGIQVFNATRGGVLEVFDRVCFDELF